MSIYDVRIYKPDKDGILRYERTISKEELSTIHWRGFQRGLGDDVTEDVKFHRIGADLNKCSECANTVPVAGRVTCSVECRTIRESKQRIIAREKEAVEKNCARCGTKFLAKRFDRLYCSKECRYSQKKGIAYGKPNT
jgi:ribosomal protein S27AE|tara:strand:+ start:212 stop:625 length:414 start_codon:yes stop_codon:yes gene_type:complete